MRKEKTSLKCAQMSVKVCVLCAHDPAFPLPQPHAASPASLVPAHLYRPKEIPQAAAVPSSSVTLSPGYQAATIPGASHIRMA